MNIRKALVTTLGTAAVLGAGLFANATSANADVKVTVHAGDTVSKLATAYGSTVNAIQQANHLNNANFIYVGQALTIPNGTQAAQYTTQTVQPAGQYTTQSTTQSAQTQTQAPVQQHTAATTSTTGSTSATTASATDGGSAKAWIAQRESGGSYSARNGQYIGKYQLSASYLHGDYSAANQEKVANQYVASRYGSWSAAKSFWQSHGWY